jgi:hypothetical protein
MSNGTLQQEPTFEGFTAWVHLVMGAPVAVMPDDSPYLRLAYDTAINIVLSSKVSGGGLDLVPNQAKPYPMQLPHPEHPIDPPETVMVQSPSIYAIAVYNFGGHTLVQIAQDPVPPLPPPPDNAGTFWSDLRTKLGMNNFAVGIVQSTSDQGTSTSMMIPRAFQDASLMTLMLMKTPWGMMYLSIVGQWGENVWGLS